MLKYLLLLTSFLFGDVAVEFYGTSYHFDREKDYNENNKYVGLVYKFENNFEVGVASYENSHYERSNDIYIGYMQPLYESEDVELGVFADGGYRGGYDSHVLFYGGLYAEYMDVYTKLAGNSKMLGLVVGYNFSIDGLFD